MPYLTTNVHTINYFDTAESNPDQGAGKPPIIMVHGLGSSQNYYMPVILQIKNHRCIALDTYGAGRSKSNGESLTMEQLVDDVIGVMDELNVPKAFIAGHSMGGPLVFTVGAAYQDRIAGIIGIGPVNPGEGGHVKAEVFTGRIETVMKDGMEPLANTIPAAATNKNSTPLQKAIIRELLIGQNPKSYASHCQVIVDAKQPDYKSITIPVLILAGDEDQSAPMVGCQFIHDHLRSDKKELKVMKGVGHWHCVEASDETAEAIQKFCDAV